MKHILQIALMLALSLHSSPSAAPQVQPAIAVSRETTYLLGPLDQHGFVDYVEAIRQRVKKGVSPDNNAVVPLVRVWGPDAARDDVDPATFWQDLQIAPPPEDGDYLQLDPDKFITDWLADGAGGELTDEQRFDLEMKELDIRQQAMRRPWVSHQVPPLAAWLQRNRQHLDRVVEASKREKFYYPIAQHTQSKGEVPEPPMLELLPEARMLWKTCQALAIRAMLHSGEGRLDDAIDDVAAIRRFAKISPGNLSSVHFLITVVREDIAAHCQEAILSSQSLTRHQLERLRSERAVTPPAWNVADALDFGERLFSLGMFAHYSRVGLPREESFLDTFSPLWHEQTFQLDWSEVMRRSNEWSDRAVAIAKADLPQRAKRLQQLQDEAISHQQRMEVLGVAHLANMPVPQRSRLLVDDMNYTTVVNSFGLDLVLQRDDYIQARRALMAVAELLAEHRLRAGQYPRRLNVLAGELPLDRFTGKPYHYKPRGDGYVIFSVGPNGKDDGGSDALKSIHNGEYVDRELDPFDKHDDIVIRMPVPPLELPLLDNEKN